MPVPSWGQGETFDPTEKPTMGTATGVVDTETILADERVVDMQNEFRILDSDSSQFMTILNKLKSQPAIREKVYT